MDYEKLYQEKKDAGQLSFLTPERIKLKEGDTIVGLYLNRDLIKTKKRGANDFYVYHFKTDEGYVQFPVSPSFDRGDGAVMVEGSVYAICYQEKRQLSRNRQFKQVSVALVQSAEEVEVGVEHLTE